jgi:hypothetical protein
MRNLYSLKRVRVTLRKIGRFVFGLPTVEIVIPSITQQAMNTLFKQVMRLERKGHRVDLYF